jgi:DNA-binding MarR family transcriptional regulator
MSIELTYFAGRGRGGIWGVGMEDALHGKAPPPRPFSREAGAWRETSQEIPQEPMFDLIELLFFAYRDFVGDADRLLLRYNFGRAHHRVLYFVDRRPGLAVAELLDLLKITKQSLSRVLKDLLDQMYLEQRPGVSDRRQRLLFPTDKGRALALELAQMQTRRFARALESLPEGAREQAAAFLAAIRDPAERQGSENASENASGGAS